MVVTTIGHHQMAIYDYNVEDEDYFVEGGIGVTTIRKHNIEIYDSKPTSKPLSNNVRMIRIKGVDFCNAFVGGVPGKYIRGLMEGDNVFF